MCGIAGLFEHRGAAVPDPSSLRAVADRLAHRGPDGRGQFVAPGIGLVHTRLSLLDPNPRSNQPFPVASGTGDARTSVLVYNGEIYNFRELRKELEGLGVHFRTTSDTEVLFEMLSRFGVASTLPRLEGMFAFAYYDPVRDTLTIARDRFGIKPLFFIETADRFAFASEVAALEPLLVREPDPLAITAYLQGYEHPARGALPLRGVRFVAPGTSLEIGRGRRSVESTFSQLTANFDREQADELERTRDSELVDRVDAMLNESVESQLFADAPVGAFCSGGVDSSLLLAIAKRHRKDFQIFHANVVGRGSELDAATALSRHLGLELKKVDVVAQDFVDLMPDVIRHYGFPYSGHPNSIPFLRVSQLVRENGVKGVLSGEGSDECYLGYEWMRPGLRETIAAQMPFARSSSGPRNARRESSSRSRAQDLVEGIPSRFEHELTFEPLREWVAQSDGLRDSARKTMRHLAHHLLTLLHRNDCLGMAASVEARFPFLDSRLVRFAVNLPARCKLRWSPRFGGEGLLRHVDKWIVREVAKRYLPKELHARPKRGFQVHAYHRTKIETDWLVRSAAMDVLGMDSREASFLLERAPRPLLLKLVQVEVWVRLFLQGESCANVQAVLRQHLKVEAE